MTDLEKRVAAATLRRVLDAALPAPGGERDVSEKAAQICESRANSLMASGNLIAAWEALKCAEAIRQSAMSQ